MLASTGLLVQSAMGAGLVADAPTETLRTGWLARERERARSTGNGLTYLARDRETRSIAEMSVSSTCISMHVMEYLLMLSRHSLRSPCRIFDRSDRK